MPRCEGRNKCFNGKFNALCLRIMIWSLMYDKVLFLGMVHAEILNHALDQYIGAKWSHKPNFMGDKKSYITTWSWDGVEYTNRWEKVSCAYEKCARISDFQ